MITDFQNLPTDCTVLTPNRRLAATLLKNHHQFQIFEKKPYWKNLDVLPFISWVQRLWNEFAIKQIQAMPIVINPQQEQMLWEEIIRQSPENDYLLQIGQTADLIKSAWNILQQWQVEINHPALALTDDSRIFQTWAQEFIKKCRKNQWLDTTRLVTLLTEKIEKQEIIPAKNILLIGFTEISPQQQKLLDACEHLGCQIQRPKTVSRNKTLQRISLQDEENEIRSMAQWAKSLLETNDNNISIACVIPHLENIRDRVEQIFSETISNSELLNLSAGKNLAYYPIIQTALALLHLNSEKISLKNFSALLHSPFLAAAEKERLARAHFENQLRYRNTHTITLSQLISSTTKLNLAQYCPILAKKLQQWLELKIDRKKLLACSEWVNIFMQQLMIFGWPGERSLNSEEYQIVQRWLELMNEFAAADPILGPLNYQDALYYFNCLSVKTIFQSQTAEAPLQILGLLEAAELPFDHLWVMGMDNLNWPPAPKPNPFIPLSLQKSLQMPHATAERELAYCRELTEQFTKSSTHVIFSHAQQNKETHLQISPLLSEIKLCEDLFLKPAVSIENQIFNSQQLEYFQDEFATPLTEIINIKGGVNIFKLQAACPFRAFAELRLHARSYAETTSGLRPQDRGEILHKTLELIWKELKTLINLKSLDEVNLQQLIEKQLEAALTLFDAEITLNKRYYQLEMQRMQKLIWDWLQLEKTRPEFKVLAQESEHSLSINQLPIKIRIDRIDELNDGSQLIIDYKTGKNIQIQHWFGDRLEEPQLPLYCMIGAENTAGISYAQLHPEKMVLKGVSKNDIGIESIKPLMQMKYTQALSWEQQQLTWRTTLEKLSQDFCQGHAKVDPKDHQTCHYCNLQSFCRIHEETR